MTQRVTNGAELLCATLEKLGITHAFGVPGSQNDLLYDALRRSSIRSILTSHELGASFMASGYYRATGKVAALLTIPGPGFTYAVPGLAEAQHDSAALLHIVSQPASAPGARYQFQAVDQEAVASPLVKRVFRLDRPDQVLETTVRAYTEAVTGEPGPVMLHWSEPALSGAVPGDRPLPRSQPVARAEEPAVGRIAEVLLTSKRPLLLAGQGTAGATALLEALAERLGSPIFTTASGRGVMPEDHPLSLGFDYARGNVGELNELIRAADCVLAVGCKLSHSGTGGFRLELPADRLIHADASRDVLGANYPARILHAERAETFLPGLLRLLEGETPTPTSAWTEEEVASWRSRLRSLSRGRAAGEPAFRGVDPPTPARFFSLLRDVLPRDTILVLDSGLHQGLARRHYEVRAPRGLLLPSDFQSMGFGLPAAIGAKLADPQRPVVAVIGDGAFAMTAMELLTAVREDVPLTVIVLNDGQLNQIRLQQQSRFGRSESVKLLNPHFEAFAFAVGARYVRVAPDTPFDLADAVPGDGVTLVEVVLGDTVGTRLTPLRGFAEESARRAIGPRGVQWLKRKLRGR